MTNGLERGMIGIQSLRWCCKASRNNEFMLPMTNVSVINAYAISYFNMSILV
jgi:hypothetical protein